MISKSYPYLSIAKKHNLPYGMVLAYAQEAHDTPVELFLAKFKFGSDDQFILDIAEASVYFKAVRSGIEPFQ